MPITLSGSILNDVVTLAYAHDIKTVYDLLNGCKQPIILGDLGYLSSETQAESRTGRLPPMDAVSPK
ncbi:hypothetical protein CSDY_1814 [Streptococcus dysgalactiae]